MGFLIFFVIFYFLFIRSVYPLGLGGSGPGWWGQGHKARRVRVLKERKSRGDWAGIVPEGEMVVWVANEQVVVEVGPGGLLEHSCVQHPLLRVRFERSFCFKSESSNDGRLMGQRLICPGGN